MQNENNVSFAAFFLIWADRQGWTVPDLHIGICHFLQHRGRNAVLMVFRGVGKSTILGVYNAWCYYVDPTYRILHQGDQDKTAYKTSRDTKFILENHPLTMSRMNGNIQGEISFFTVPGHNDPRNPSMQASGILSNITSSRADEIQNDDVEVPKNVGTPENREKLRHRLSEQIHIAVPGAKKLFIGTPHSHDSIYEEQINKGAELLKIPLFSNERAIEYTPGQQRYAVGFKPEIVFAGIGEFTQVLESGKDYTFDRGDITFTNPLQVSRVDCYAGNAWPERFTTDEMKHRRTECNTHNEWDSQYQLHAKPIGDIRLNPEKIIAYDVEPMIVHANRSVAMYLGRVRIAGMAIKWDPSGAKLKSDSSVLAVVLQDEIGRRYWHRSVNLSGEVAEFSTDGKTIIGGQVMQICKVVKEMSAPRVVVETNGIGGFAPSVLKAAFKQQGITCGVTENHESANKNKRILESLEPLICSGMLWAHLSVLNGPMWEEMADWNPAVKEQPDDHLDAGAGACSLNPERIQSVNVVGNPTANNHENWQPYGGPIEVQTDY